MDNFIPRICSLFPGPCALRCNCSAGGERLQAFSPHGESCGQARAILQFCAAASPGNVGGPKPFPKEHRGGNVGGGRLRPVTPCINGCIGVELKLMIEVEGVVECSTSNRKFPVDCANRAKC